MTRVNYEFYKLVYLPLHFHLRKWEGQQLTWPVATMNHFSVVHILICIPTSVAVTIHWIGLMTHKTAILENVEHCGGETERADTRILCH